ncbi:hypothetical protein [Paenibacillus senegalensis]|uniref:hypothetical protein n=1 Tax=Paenibacillus senegalensis TaxID=1465766 RepID=UPI0002896F87|nr:hypothetical protein [Paenibacillus senegalensis]
MNKKMTGDEICEIVTNMRNTMVKFVKEGEIGRFFRELDLFLRSTQGLSIELKYSLIHLFLKWLAMCSVEKTHCNEKVDINTFSSFESGSYGIRHMCTKCGHVEEYTNKPIESGAAQ